MLEHDGHNEYNRHDGLAKLLKRVCRILKNPSRINQGTIFHTHL